VIYFIECYFFKKKTTEIHSLKLIKITSIENIINLNVTKNKNDKFVNKFTTNTHGYSKKQKKNLQMLQNKHFWSTYVC